MLVFNKLFNNGVYPEAWAMGLIVPLHKKDDVLEPSNHRGITLTPVLDKLYAFILHQRLSAWAEEHGLRAECQAGFRKDFRTTNQSSILRTLIESSKANKKKLFCAFIDYSRAFDTIARVKLWARLKQLGVHGCMLRAMQAIYQKVQAAVRTPQGNTETFQSTMGVKQGWSLSPLLFGLYIEGLEKALHRSDCQPPEIEGEKISLLMFIDNSEIFFSTASGYSKGLRCSLQVLTGTRIDCESKQDQNHMF